MPLDGRTMAVADGKFPCSTCDKIFAHRRSLNRHMKIHDSSKQHVCTVCDKAFYRKDKLMEHMIVHNKPPKVDLLFIVCLKYFDNDHILISVYLFSFRHLPSDPLLPRPLFLTPPPTLVLQPPLDLPISLFPLNVSTLTTLHPVWARLRRRNYVPRRLLPPI